MSFAEKRAKSNAKKKVPHATPRESVEANVGATLKNALFGAFVAAVASVILLFIISAICYSTDDPDAFTTPLALVALYLSSIIGGFAAVRKNQSSALLCGAVCGVIFILFFLCVTLCFHGVMERSFSIPVAFALRGVSILCSILGGFLGLKRKSSSRRR